MEIPVQYLPWLRRSSLEIYVIVYLAYSLDPKDWDRVPPQLHVEVQSLFRDIKAAIKRKELKAVLHGSDVDYLANCLLSDFAPFAQKKARSDPAWRQLAEFCDVWETHSSDAERVEARHRKPNISDQDRINLLKEIRAELLIVCPAWPETDDTAESVARAIAKKVPLSWETIRQILTDRHSPSKLLVERKKIDPFWKVGAQKSGRRTAAS